jgi:hypothetical protein
MASPTKLTLSPEGDPINEAPGHHTLPPHREFNSESAFAEGGGDTKVAAPNVSATKTNTLRRRNEIPPVDTIQCYLTDPTNVIGKKVSDDAARCNKPE